MLGLVVLAFLALFVGTLLFVYPSLAGATRPISIRFRHDEGVAPLKPGSAVMLSGALEVGRIVDVRKERATVQTSAGPLDHLFIIVDAQIQADLELYDDCQITTDQPPVGGSGVVVILDVGTPDAGPARLPIAGLPPRSLAAAIGALHRRLLGRGGLMDRLEAMFDAGTEGSLTAKISQSLDDVNAMTRELRLQLDAREQMTLMSKVHGIIDNINAATAALRAQLATDDHAAALAKVLAALDRLETGLAEAHALLEENRPVVRNTLLSVESASRKLDDEVLTALRAEFDRHDPGSLLGKTHAGLDRLNASLDNVVTMTDTGRKLVVLNRPALQRAIDNIKDVSDQLNRAVGEIVLAPWRLFKPPPAGLKRLDVLEAARSFAAAAAALDDALARLEALQSAAAGEQELIGSEEEVAAIRGAVRLAFERFQAAEEYLWQQMKK